MHATQTRQCNHILLPLADAKGVTRDVPMRGTACFSECGLYRYSLSRVWDDSRPAPLWALLNPSTADEKQLDPTLRRCCGFSYRWGFGGFVVWNVFAFRSTDPARMRASQDPVGPLNDAWLQKLAQNAPFIVAGWGNHGEHQAREQAIRQLLRQIQKPIKALGITKTGQPVHPLYQRADKPPLDWQP